MDQLGLRLNVGADFAMADQQHLRRLAEQAHPVLQEELDSVVGLFVRKGCKRVMYVLYGLPEIALIETIAHEWAHAWQGENCPLLQDRLIREGFAEWAAYKALRAMGQHNGVAPMERSSKLYGEGLRAMIEMERKYGVSGVLDFCRRAE
jgi:hypothetical protein